MNDEHKIVQQVYAAKMTYRQQTALSVHICPL